MRGFWKRIAPVVVLVSVLAMPSVVTAQTVSVSQTITVTARVAPMRSIVVNEQGKITKIYSNTAEAVAPKVYLNEVPGQAVAITPELLALYNTVIAEQDNLIGVEIPVSLPVANKTSVHKILFGAVSTLTSRWQF